jgi:hypothetical protein
LFAVVGVEVVVGNRLGEEGEVEENMQAGVPSWVEGPSWAVPSWVA